MLSSNSRKEGRNYSGFTGGSLAAVSAEKPFHHAVADRKDEAVAPVQTVVEQPKVPDALKL